MIGNKKIKVLYIIPLVKIGGAEVVFDSLDKLDNSNIDIIKIDLSISKNLIFYYIRAFFIIFKLFKNNNFDFVISSLWKSHFILFFTSFFFNVKLVPFIHSSNFFNKFDAFFSKWILKRSFAVIVDSKSVSESISKYVLHDRIFVVSMRTSKSSVRKIYKSFNSRLRFVFVGRVSESKRLDKSFMFLEQLKVKLPCYALSFDIFGPLEGKYYSTFFKNYLDKLNFSVNLQGSLENKFVHNKLIEYDFYLQFSDIEGMSMSVMDAMSVGLIPIVTNAGEIGNYAANNINSLLIEKDDQIDLVVDKLLVLLMESKNILRISNNAFKTFESSNLFKDDIILVLNKISKCVE